MADVLQGAVVPTLYVCRDAQHERSTPRERAAGWLTANVRARRQRMGFTQEQLAERAGVAPTYVVRIEAATETVNVTLRVLGALTVALGGGNRQWKPADASRL